MYKILVALLVASLTLGCTYALKVTNEGDYYSEPIRLRQQVKVGIFETNDDLLNSVVNKLQKDHNVAEIRSIENINSALDMDYVQKLERKARYRSSGQNFFITFPGYLVFAHAWAGYKYYIDIATKSTLMDNSGEILRTTTFKTPYEIRYTSFPRGATTAIVGWAIPLLGILNIFPAIGFAKAYDTRATDEFYEQIEDSYSTFVAGKIIQQIKQQVENEPKQESEYETAPVVITGEMNREHHNKKDYSVVIYKVSYGSLIPLEEKTVKLPAKICNLLEAAESGARDLDREDYGNILASFRLSGLPQTLDHSAMNVYSLQDDKIVNLVKENKNEIAKK